MFDIMMVFMKEVLENANFEEIKKKSADDISTKNVLACKELNVHAQLFSEAICIIFVCSFIYFHTVCVRREEAV